MSVDLRNDLNIELPRCRGAYLEDAPDAIWNDGDWVLEPKIDGNRVSLQIGAKGSLLIGRNRQDFLKGVDRAGRFRNLSHLNQSLAAIACKEFDGTVLDGELTEVFTEDGSLDEASTVRRENGEFVGYAAWTVLFLKGKDVRGCSEAERYRMTAQVIQKMFEVQNLALIERVPATEENLKRFFDRGEEGAVAKKLSGTISTSSRTCRTWYKLKGDKNRTVDAFIVGVQEGKSGGSGKRGVKPKPNGKAATFTVAMMKDGKMVEVGKMANLTHDMRTCGLKDFENYHRQVVEMQISGFDGKRFRWPRFVKFRPDKTPEDCVFEDQVGGRDEV